MSKSKRAIAELQKKLYIASTTGKLGLIIAILEPRTGMLCNSHCCLVITLMKWNIIISYMPINAAERGIHTLCLAMRNFQSPKRSYQSRETVL